MKFIVVVLVVILVWSIYKFYRQFGYEKMVLNLTLDMDPNNPNTLLEQGSAYINVQRYLDAYYCFERYLDRYQSVSSTDTIEKVKLNMDFCKGPLHMGSSTPKNHTFFHYLHHFFLVRIGRKRYVFLSEETHLAAHSRMRNRR